MPRVPDSQAVLSAKNLLFHPVPLRACVVHPLLPVTSKQGVGAPQCIHSWETLGRGFACLLLPAAFTLERERSRWAPKAVQF